ncbi:DUF1796 family putative cysteine peptidase [Acinetobacter shaoyimingii]|uniref:Papain-like cysteine peptidase n=1 Tax=Acinetobacter shaoyimingii TaxID=2715164 RepID=A0A6G8RWW6_9GAMM|nr:DUF1796 family putative cysteine peptidase [Acinetobacter shaoyimingii]QIO06365.1 hypothetical protein G8E00_10585 [Acinetobacter shaoyimingii]
MNKYFKLLIEINIFKKLTIKLVKKFTKFYETIQTFRNKNDPSLWLSLGENCLSDSILQRSNLKSYSSLYGSARSNIDYNIEIQNKNFKDLLNKDQTVYGYVNWKEVLRSRLYNRSDNIFHDLHCNGFEFTHHDWVKNEKFVQTFERRILRTQKSIGHKNFIFLYHHRYTEKSNIDLLRQKLNTFREIFEKNNKHCHIILFYQHKISNIDERNLVLKNVDHKIIEFVFHTQYIWEGDDQDIFWARNDNDLIEDMIQKSKDIIFNQ